jgi:hypothetical protein
MIEFIWERDEAISLINEPIQPERREEASAREIARKRWGMEVRTKPGVASQSELK